MYLIAPVGIKEYAVSNERSAEDDVEIRRLVEILTDMDDPKPVEVKVLKERKPMRGCSSGLIYYDDHAGFIRDVPSP